MLLDIVEKMTTISGEAPIIGHPVFLVRFSRCNLDCRFCDTPYRDEVNERLSVDRLADEIREVTSAHPGMCVLLTGGEPLLGERQQMLNDLIGRLPDLSVYIETNGTILLPDSPPENAHYVVDWKPPTAHADQPFREVNLRRIRPDRDTIKLVLAESDLDWAAERIAHIRSINPDLPIYLSAQWHALPLDRLAAFITENRLPVRMSVQLHKVIWGPDKRGV